MCGEAHVVNKEEKTDDIMRVRDVYRETLTLIKWNIVRSGAVAGKLALRADQ